MNRCKSLSQKGVPCKKRPILDDEYCLYHKKEAQRVDGLSEFQKKVRHAHARLDNMEHRIKILEGR